MRFGLIGCGWIVQRDHLPAMLQSDKVEVVATADVSVEPADETIAACQAAGVTLAIYHNYLYYYEHRLATRLLAEGAIGDVVATEVCGLASRPWLGAEQFRPGWRFDPALALGKATGLVNIAWGEGTARFEIDGTDGYICYVYDEGAGYFGGSVRAVRVGSAEGPTMTHHGPPGRTQFTPAIFADLVDTITGERKAFRSFGPDGRRALEIALAAYQSVADGRPAALPVSPDQPVYSAGAVPQLESRKAPAHAS